MKLSNMNIDLFYCYSVGFNFRLRYSIGHTVFCYLTLAICLLFTTVARGQWKDSLEVQPPKIMVTARVHKDGKILLRWAVTTPKAWRRLNTYGYQLKRYTITRDRTTLPQPIEKQLGTFKPKPVEAWMPIIENNDNAAVMAQSLYGESFDVSGMDKLSAIVNLAEEQVQRFTWGLYVADQDFSVAQMAGLGYEDTDVKPNEKYLYKVISLVPESELVIEEGGVFTGIPDYQELPKPVDFVAIFLDRRVLLSWNYDILKFTYNNYFIERSEDGKTFARLSNLPLATLNNSEKTDQKTMFYNDSISNGKTYYYRILGKTAFGELGPVSKVFSGQGKEVLAYVPQITNKNFIDENSIILEWEFLSDGNKQISGFELSRSDNATGKYKVVIKNIPPEARKVRYDSLQPTNYMTVTAVGKNGSSRTSFPVLVQPVDSVPPAKPVGLEGKIDSVGIVTLNWKANAEKDMLGYRVFRGNNKKEEYSQITVSPHRGTTYYDSVSVKNLNSKVYYQLVAVDQRFNMSEFSDILELKKPDFIKPAQPVFKSYEIIEGKVNLTWANSSSDDVVKHEIYRKENEDWKLVHTVDSTLLTKRNKKKTTVLNPESWTDETVMEGHQYSYTIIAVDDSNLESVPAPPLTVVIPKTSLHPPVKGLDSYVDKKNGFLELYWKPYDQPNVAELAIYKGIKDKPVLLLQNVLPDVKRIVDDNVKPNNEYVYIVRAVFKDGSISQTSTLNIKF